MRSLRLLVVLAMGAFIGVTAPAFACLSDNHNSTHEINCTEKKCSGEYHVGTDCDEMTLWGNCSLVTTGFEMICSSPNLTIDCQSIDYGPGYPGCHCNKNHAGDDYNIKYTLTCVAD